MGAAALLEEARHRRQRHDLRRVVDLRELPGPGCATTPNVRLLWSGDWSVYRESDYWVAIYGQGFTTAAGANAWCDAQGFAADDCFAKRLSRTAGPAGTTEPRS